MNSTILYLISYVLGAALCFYLWQKFKDKDYLWLFLLGLLSVIFDLIKLATSFTVQPYSSIISIVFSIAVIILVVKIVAKRR